MEVRKLKSQRDEGEDGPGEDEGGVEEVAAQAH